MTQDETGSPRKSFAFAMPMWNEEQVAKSFLEDLLKGTQELVRSVIVVDDGSTDLTAIVLNEIASKNPESVSVIVSENRGHGPATILAWKKALDSGADIIVMTDGDGNISVDGLKKIALLTSHDELITEGVRVGRDDPWYRRLVSLVTRILVWSASGRFPKDANTPHRGYTREALSDLYEKVPSNSRVPNLFVSALTRKVDTPVREIEVASIHREGASKGGVTWGKALTGLPSKRFLQFVMGAGKEWISYSAPIVLKRDVMKALLGRMFGGRSIGRYGAIGVTGMSIDFAVFLGLVAVGVPPVLATAISTGIGIANNYVLNARLNFSSEISLLRASRFFLVGATGLSVSAAIVFGFTQIGLAPIVAKLMSIPFVAVGQFLTHRFWTFRN